MLSNELESASIGTKRASTTLMDGSAIRIAAWQPSLGAVPADQGGKFSVWAPDAVRVDLIIEHDGFTVTRPLSRREDGTFTGWQPDLTPGTRYRFSLDGRAGLPDPASRWQPDGVHGASAFVDPTEFVWADGEWSGVRREDLIIYELHVGTFTPEGTFAGVEAQLGYLAALGVTAIELMPIAECSGARNWGYDGVDLFAPSHVYGTPDDLRRLVNAAHLHGLAVILDVVYNHLGPEGAYLAEYSRWYFSTTHTSQWGAAVNLDGEHSEHVREFFIENALHWIHEYHVDGLRLDATHALVDAGSRHFLSELRARVHGEAGRPVVLIAEDERNLAMLIEPPPRGYGLDAVWADDFHHQIRVALTGQREGYFGDFSGTASDLAATIRQGWFYTGQRTLRSGQPRGSDPSGLPASRFVVCLQNHDQVGNRAFGDRLHHQVGLDVYRAASALLLLAPQIPLLFMGQEWAASTPFLYFTDHEPALGRLVTEGRRQEFAAFAGFSDPITRLQIPDPQDPSTFGMSRLAWEERALLRHAGVARLYHTLLDLRRKDPAWRSDRTRTHAAAIDERTIVLRRSAWALVVRLEGGAEIALDLPGRYAVVLTTEDDPFCEAGRVPVFAADQRIVRFHGPAAVLLKQQ
jgi:maltooligosyltrehalose trehalohydrolase